MAMAVAVLIGSAAMWMLTQGTVSSWRTANVSGNDLTQWGLNNRIVLDSRLANGVTLYSEYTSSAVTAEGNDGLGVGKRGNFLVLSSTLPDYVSGQARVTKITGYVYNSTDHTISKFVLDPVSAADQAAFRLHGDVLALRFSTLPALQRVAENVYLEEIDPLKMAFYHRSAREAVLNFKLGNPLEAKHVRDSRLVEVSFYIRP